MCAMCGATMRGTAKTGVPTSGWRQRTTAMGATTLLYVHATVPGSSRPSFWRSQAVGTFRKRPNETVLMSPFAAAE
jgi:hypothetical protein